MVEVNYRYKRSQNGETIHRFGCGRAGNAIEWRWAEGKTEAQIREQLRPTQLMYRYCKVCFGDHDREETERQLLRRQLELEQAMDPELNTAQFGEKSDLFDQAWVMTSEEIQALSMEDYTKLRRQLLARVKAETNEFEHTGKWPTPERLLAMSEAEQEEADRKRLIEELKRQQSQ